MSVRPASSVVSGSLVVGLLSLAAPAQACMNEMVATIRFAETRSFVTAMAAIVAVQMIVRPALDLAGSKKAVIAGWLVAGATVCGLVVLFGAISIHLNGTGVAYAFAVALFIPPTYRFVRARRQPPSEDLLAALHERVNEELAATARPAPSEAAPEARASGARASDVGAPDGSRRDRAA